MKRFMNFIGKIRQNEAVFLGKVIFFLPALMILWIHLCWQDSADTGVLFMSSLNYTGLRMRYITHGYILK